MSTFLILGDPHLGKNLLQGKVGVGSNLNSRIVDQLNLLDWTLDQALEMSANNIIITGDIFEEVKPPISLVTLFVAWLKKCQNNMIHVHIVLGNHDTLRSGFVYSSPLDIINETELDNNFVYKNINSIIIDTTVITFLPFRDRKSFGSISNGEALSIIKDSLIYELSGIPQTYRKVLVGHFAIEGSIPVGDEIDDIANELFCPVEILDSKSDKDFIIKYLPTRPLKKVSIIIPKNTSDTTNYVLSHLKNSDYDNSIVKMEIFLESTELQSINKSVIENFLLNKGVFNVLGISESKISFKKDISNTLDTKIDTISAIKKYTDIYIENDQKSDFIDLAMEIYNSFKLESKE